MPRKVTLVYVRKTTGALTQYCGTPKDIVQHMGAHNLDKADVVVVQGDPLTSTELFRRAKLEETDAARRRLSRKS